MQLLIKKEYFLVSNIYLIKIEFDKFCYLNS